MLRDKGSDVAGQGWDRGHRDGTGVSGIGVSGTEVSGTGVSQWDRGQSVGQGSDLCIQQLFGSFDEFGQRLVIFHSSSPARRRRTGRRVIEPTRQFAKLPQAQAAVHTVQPKRRVSSPIPVTVAKILPCCLFEVRHYRNDFAPAGCACAQAASSAASITCSWLARRCTPAT
jgi:hypothetical protein